MGKPSRDKGNRMERELVHILTAAGIPARRVPLSGAMKDTGFGGDLLVADNPSCQRCQLPLRGHSFLAEPMCGGFEIDTDSEERWEVKVRSQGFKQIYKWLEDNAVLAVRSDRHEWIVCMKLKDYLEDRG